MNILIVGCGKVGSMLASQLDQMGHDVAVLDREEAHFALLDSDFSGYTICGVPIDQDVLKQAGRQRQHYGLSDGQGNFSHQNGAGAYF